METESDLGLERRMSGLVGKSGIRMAQKKHRAELGDAFDTYELRRTLSCPSDVSALAFTRLSLPSSSLKSSLLFASNIPEMHVNSFKADELNTHQLTVKLISSSLTFPEIEVLRTRLGRICTRKLNAAIATFTSSRNIQAAIHHLFPAPCFLYTLQKYTDNLSQSSMIAIASFLSVNGYPYDALVIANLYSDLSPECDAPQAYPMTRSKSYSAIYPNLIPIFSPRSCSQPSTASTLAYTRIYISAYINLSFPSKAHSLSTTPALLLHFNKQSRKYAWTKALEIYTSTKKSDDLYALFIETCCGYEKYERAWKVYEESVGVERYLGSSDSAVDLVRSNSFSKSRIGTQRNVSFVANSLPQFSHLLSNVELIGRSSRRGIYDAILKCCAKAVLGDSEKWEARMWSVYSASSLTRQYRPVLEVMSATKRFGGLVRVWRDYLDSRSPMQGQAIFGGKARDRRCESMFIRLFCEKGVKAEVESCYEKCRDLLDGDGFRCVLGYAQREFRERVVWDMKCAGIERILTENDPEEEDTIGTIGSNTRRAETMFDDDDADLMSKEEAVMVLESWLIQLLNDSELLNSDI